MHKIRRTAEEMFPLVEHYLQGRQSLQAFCAEHAISANQLYYWRRKYHQKPQGERGLHRGWAACCRRTRGDGDCLPWWRACASVRSRIYCMAYCSAAEGGDAGIIAFGSSYRYYVHRAPTDMRKSFDGLSGLVRSELHRIWGDVFVFFNRKRNLVNNLDENSIRPLALGRKNYLFAGSHAAAQRAAVIY